MIQFIKFGIVGFTNTLIGYLVYTVSLKIFRCFRVFPQTDYFFAQLLMFLLSVLWSFYWNNKYVFVSESKRTWWKTFLKTYIAYAGTGIVLGNLLMLLWVEVLGISEVIAPLFSLVITIPLNFVINKFWSFGDGGKEGSAAAMIDKKETE